MNSKYVSHIQMAVSYEEILVDSVVEILGITPEEARSRLESSEVHKRLFNTEDDYIESSILTIVEHFKAEIQNKVERETVEK